MLYLLLNMVIIYTLSATLNKKLKYHTLTVIYNDKSHAQYICIRR